MNLYQWQAELIIEGAYSFHIYCIGNGNFS